MMSVAAAARCNHNIAVRHKLQAAVSPQSTPKLQFLDNFRVRILS